MLYLMKTLAEKVAQLRTAKGWTQGELAAAVGVSQGSIGNIESGIRENPRAATILGIAKALGVSAQWLQSGEGPMHPGTLGRSLVNTEPGPEIRGKVPLISWVQAGEWRTAADPHQPGQADQWLDCPVSHSGGTFALRVRGDSMTAPHGNSRTYPEGCIIFVDPEQRTPDNGDRVVACLTGTDEVTFKVYKNEDGRQWLQPLNPSHEPIRENFHVLGKVLGKWEDG